MCLICGISTASFFLQCSDKGGKLDTFMDSVFTKSLHAYVSIQTRTAIIISQVKRHPVVSVLRLRRVQWNSLVSARYAVPCLHGFLSLPPQLSRWLQPINSLIMNNKDQLLWFYWFLRVCKEAAFLCPTTAPQASSPSEKMQPLKKSVPTWRIQRVKNKMKDS